MRAAQRLRTGLIALAALAGACFSSSAYADSGTVRLQVIKAGWIIGGSGGGGSLSFHGKRYSLSVGGVSWGLTFGASETNFSGTVSRISRPSDVAGVYTAAAAGAAVGGGVHAIILTNEKGAVMQLQGPQVGLILSADLNGLAIALK